MNELGKSNSLYLRQHASNPVYWKLWDEALFKANTPESPLLIISIGYSSCHWCHVMEEESFEDEQVASVMNEKYVCIKVDRERHPEVDARYMNALQLMTGTGGWPLNIIALPDGTPIYGGTYFSKSNWLEVLHNVGQLWSEDSERVLAYGEEMRNGLKQMIDVSLSGSSSTYSKTDFEDVVSFWMRTIDPIHGGPNGSPKFPMPSNYQFLLDYAFSFNDDKVLEYCERTLSKMALGGIFDWIHGGMTRYSTDRFWKVPHFEKMLYDNAQLLTLYAQGARIFQSPLFLETAKKISHFLTTQMQLPSGLYASALDADSKRGNDQRIEGAFYTWSIEELDQLNLPERDLFNTYFDITPTSAWEGVYVLHRMEELSTFITQAQRNDLDPDELEKRWHQMLTEAVSERLDTHPEPQRDNKAITSWNALLVNGWYDLHLAATHGGFDTLALNLLEAIETHLIDGEVQHEFEGNIGYLDDYSTSGSALLKGYALTGNETYVDKALQVATRIEARFGWKEIEPFYGYTSKASADWQNVLEIEDNVIPSANSLTAQFFHELSIYSGDTSWAEKSAKMTAHIHPKVFKHGQNFSNWLQLALRQTLGNKEIAVIGEEARALAGKLSAQHYMPQTTMLSSIDEGSLPLTKYRKKDETTIYVCHDGACQQPTSSVESALQQWGTTTAS